MTILSPFWIVHSIESTCKSQSALRPKTCGKERNGTSLSFVVMVGSTSLASLWLPFPAARQSHNTTHGKIGRVQCVYICMGAHGKCKLPHADTIRTLIGSIFVALSSFASCVPTLVPAFAGPAVFAFSGVHVHGVCRKCRDWIRLARVGRGWERIGKSVV